MNPSRINQCVLKRDDALSPTLFWGVKPLTGVIIPPPTAGEARPRTQQIRASASQWGEVAESPPASTP
eukprot:3014356-Pleurochrysis_carterae.AAC.1